MMKNRFSLPKRYWIYLGLVLICPNLLIANYYRTDSWTGDMPFSEFTEREWVLFTVFLIEELIILVIMVLSTLFAGRISRKQYQEIVDYWEQNKFMGIQPDDYDYIWFDFSCTQRALILKQNNIYKLYVHKYDEHRGEWQIVDSVSVYDSLAELKKALFFDFHFYCEYDASN